MARAWTASQILGMTLDAVVALLPRNCLERLEELERQAAPEKRPRPAGKAAARQSQLLEKIRGASSLAARLGPLWHAARVGLAFAAHAAREAARDVHTAVPACAPRKRGKGTKKQRAARAAGQLRIWGEAEGPAQSA